MRRSPQVAAPLLASAAAALLTGCHHGPEMQRCVDAQNRVVDPSPGYMPYETVQGLSALYGQQTLLVERMRALQFHEAEIVAPIAAAKDKQPLPQAEFDAMITDAARTQLDLKILGESLKGLDGQYVAESRKL